MIYPTISDLTKGEYNRYEIALAAAKCARMITNEYTRQRQEAESAATGTKEADRPLTSMIDREIQDEKAVKLAIGRIYKGEYVIVHKDPEEQEREEQAILAGLTPRYDEPYPIDLSAEDDDELADEEDLGPLDDQDEDVLADMGVEDSVSDEETAEASPDEG